MFDLLNKINSRPQLFGVYTTPEMWNDEYVSKKMLEFHLNPDTEMASRNPDFINRSASWIINKFGIDKNSSVCDFGCGPGLYTSRFAETGADVTGIDLSENSINYAGQTAGRKNLTIDYVISNYLDFITDKKFDLITMIYCDFCVLNQEQKKVLFEKFRNYLKPDGHLFLDVFSLNLFNSFKEGNSFEFVKTDGFWSAEPHYIFKNTFLFNDEKVFCDKYNIYEATREREIYNWLKCYNLETIKNEFSANGFTVLEHFENVAGDAYTGSSNEIALVAKVKA